MLESSVEGASLEIENGYPLVADLQQLSLLNHIRMSVDDMKQQETVDDIVDEHLLHGSNTSGAKFFKRAVDNVATGAEEVIGPLLDVTSIVHNASSVRASVTRRMVDVQDG
ncbi:unnamed protein product [Wuchereria bancrofti]|uniref:Uncharacterized protein n=1 Tax=Wuchereria bancrofti TaxID=6293 RepID=A0A3P7E8T5_WUCBA|nr:unnamed protein product [Wuchereria bancrofti]